MKSAFWKNFWPVIIWAFLVLILSAIPGNAFPKVQRFWDWLGPDKIIHLFFYGVLSFFLTRGFARQFYDCKSRWSVSFYAFIIGTVFGLLIEVLQYFVFVGRNGNLYDGIANLIGSLIGVAIFWLFNRKIMA